MPIFEEFAEFASCPDGLERTKDLRSIGVFVILACFGL
jgi:hypothetical protein